VFWEKRFMVLGVQNMRLSIVILLLSCLLILPSSLALTGSLGNAKMILRPDVAEGETVTIEKTILVNNVNEVPITVTLEPDFRYKKIIDIPNNEFIMQPGDSKNVHFTITLKSAGDYQGKIMVKFVSADPDFNSPPIGLSSQIYIFAEGPVNENYYDVMNATDEDEGTVPMPDGIADPNDPDDDDTDDDDNEADDSTGDSDSQSGNKKGGISVMTMLMLVIGLLIVFVLILIVVGIIKKLK